ncbi:hypothetical protein [Moritella viscosa]|uniref:hypothetical protein n=1 Tax=Moritella viscosa TaxID=80854 RepID=UPI00091984B2|nr:hypothetical protein [Moritella viscosa]SGY86141.1 Serine hydroxymethyltransferase [Moritella viscosa]
MPQIIRNVIHVKSIHELFELLKKSTSDDVKEIAINELVKRGYSLDDIHITLN